MQTEDRLSQLAVRIRDEIRASGGAIAFSRFMERALYEPELGYYENAIVGRAGDFQTSVSAGALFGELMAFQARRWRSGHPSGPDPWVWVETGAHDGVFALDFLSALRAWDPSDEMPYIIVEPSPTRRRWQQERLAPYEGRVQWADTVPSVTGVIFANELLDAFPVERLGWDPMTGDWFRWGVRVEAEGFVWCRLPLEGALRKHIPRLPDAIFEMLPAGYTVEFSPGAESWWHHAAGQLRAGRLVTFDYGFGADEWLRPERIHGTLRGYRRHRMVDDVLAEPGSTDLTAHVDFGRMQVIGEELGLVTEWFGGQDRFLSRLMTETLETDSGFGAWSLSRVRQFQTLTHPQHLGRAFRVLVQSRTP
jgi:SAM-dependent MidA family methyltransferase